MSDNRRERNTWVGFVLASVLAGSGAWIWTGLGTVACGDGGNVGGPSLFESILLACGLALPVAVSARGARLSWGTVAAIVFSSAVVSFFVIVLVRGIWMIVHQCLD